MILEKRVLENYENLNTTDIHIWTYVKQNREAVQKMTLTELAEFTNVSRTTISRFVKKINLDGYSEFKFRLAMEPNESVTFDVNDFNFACDILIDYIELLKELDFTSEFDLLEKSERIFVYGTGDIQESVANQFKRMMVSQEKLAYTITNKTLDKTIFNLMDSNDLLFIISLSGDNTEAINIAKKAKLNGTKIISITDFKNNKLNTLSDETIYIYSPEINFVDPFNSYRITTMYYVLIEMFIIKYSVYRNLRK